MQTISLCGATWLLVAGSLPALACNPAIVTIHAGEPATYKVPDDTALSARIAAHGAPASDGQVLALDARDGTGYWVDRDSLEDAVFLLGGSPGSYRYSGPDHCAPKDLPIALDEVPDAEAPQEIAAASGLQPESGRWHLQQGTPVVEQCPDVMRAAMAGSAFEPPAAGDLDQRLVVTVPFHPDQLEMSRKMKLAWRTTAPGAWRAEALQSVFAGLPQGGGAGSRLTWDLKVLGPDRIRHSSRLTVAIPPEAAAAFASDVCIVSTTSHWLRTGD